MAMRIKPQGGIYTVIRSVYDKDASRGVDKTIGSFKADLLDIPEEIMSQLEDSERSDLLVKFAKLKVKKDTAQNFERLDKAEGAIKDIAHALRNFARFSSAAEAEKVYAAIADLKVSMREAGYKQTRAKQEPAPVSAEKQPAAKADATASLGAKNGGKKS